MNGFHDFQVNVVKRMFKFDGVPDSGGTSTFYLPKSDKASYRVYISQWSCCLYARSRYVGELAVWWSLVVQKVGRGLVLGSISPQTKR